MNEFLKKVLETGEVEEIGGKKLKLQWNIDKNEGEFIQRVLKKIDARKTLEIGTAYGISGMFICEAIAGKSGAQHIAIDPYQDKKFNNLGIENIRRAGYGDLLQFHNDFSHFVLPELVRRKETIDFALIDGYHLFDYAFVDFFYVDKLLKPGGVVILDDAAWTSVHKVAQYVATNRAYRLFEQEKRPIGSPTWKQNLLVSAMRMLNKYDTLDESIRHYDDFKKALELPGAKYLAFIKEKEDEEFRTIETFHKAF